MSTHTERTRNKGPSFLCGQIEILRTKRLASQHQRLSLTSSQRLSLYLFFFLKCLLPLLVKFRRHQLLKKEESLLALRLYLLTLDNVTLNVLKAGSFEELGR